MRGSGSDAERYSLRQEYVVAWKEKPQNKNSELCIFHLVLRIVVM